MLDLSTMPWLSQTQRVGVYEFLKRALPNDYYTIDEIAIKAGLEKEEVEKPISALVDEGFLERVFAVQCPECGHYIAKTSSISQFVPQNTDYCYCCEREIEVTADNITVLFQKKSR